MVRCYCFQPHWPSLESVLRGRPHQWYSLQLASLKRNLISFFVQVSCLSLAVLHESWTFVRFVTCLMLFSEVWLFLFLSQDHRILRPYHIQGDMPKNITLFIRTTVYFNIFTSYLRFVDSKYIIFPFSKSTRDIVRTAVNNTSEPFKKLLGSTHFCSVDEQNPLDPIFCLILPYFKIQKRYSASWIRLLIYYKILISPCYWRLKI